MIRIKFLLLLQLSLVCQTEIIKINLEMALVGCLDFSPDSLQFL